MNNCNAADKNMNEFSQETHCLGSSLPNITIIGVMKFAGNANVRNMALLAIKRGEDEKSKRHRRDLVHPAYGYSNMIIFF